ncbi:MAG: hypothetical protein M5R36_29085 [Deltaproteobacteria bacterium]|nr:hypothetical protein [Deltaproteobacteria bacterium]
MGTPYQHQTPTYHSRIGFGDIPNWVRAELEMRFPSRTIEVLNAGAGSQNSSAVRHVTGELLKLDLDLLIVMTGNNEGYVAQTPFNEPLQRWIVYRTMKKALLSKPDPLDRSYFTPQDEDTRKIEENFRSNLRRIADAAGGSRRAAGSCHAAY